MKGQTGSGIPEIRKGEDFSSIPIPELVSACNLRYGM